jgi:hypothetical protein
MSDSCCAGAQMATYQRNNVTKQQIAGCPLLAKQLSAVCLRWHAVLLHAAAEPLLNTLQHHLHQQPVSDC